MTQHQAMLEVSNISVEFGGLKAVSDFSMQVRQGTIHALIGPNGAGKSTVFNCISRFYTPNQGSVRFLGENLIGLPASQMASRGIARSFQNLELFAELSALDNVILGTHALQKQTDMGSMQRLSRLFAAPDKSATAFAESLLERGHEVSVLAPADEDTPLPEYVVGCGRALPIHQSLCIQCLTAALLFGLCIAANAGTNAGLIPPLTGGFAFAILWLVLFSTFFAYAVYYLSLRLYSAAQVSSVIYLSPPVTMLWAWLMFGEPLSTLTFIGLAVTLSGVWLTAAPSGTRRAASP